MRKYAVSIVVLLALAAGCAGVKLVTESEMAEEALINLMDAVNTYSTQVANGAYTDDNGDFTETGLELWEENVDQMMEAHSRMEPYMEPYMRDEGATAPALIEDFYKALGAWIEDQDEQLRFTRRCAAFASRVDQSACMAEMFVDNLLEWAKTDDDLREATSAMGSALDDYEDFLDE